MLKDEIENKIICLKKTKKKRQFKLTCHTRDPCHVTKITSMKGNKKKYEFQYLINSMSNDEKSM
jgi:hypothetical protein